MQKQILIIVLCRLYYDFFHEKYSYVQRCGEVNNMLDNFAPCRKMYISIRVYFSVNLVRIMFSYVFKYKKAFIGSVTNWTVFVTCCILRCTIRVAYCTVSHIN